MLQPRGGADLREKALAAECGTEIRMQHFDRDIAIVFEVVREIHRRHAAGPKLALEAIATAKGDSESRKHRGQVVSNPSRDAASRKRSS